jgi:adenylate cyclase
VELIVERSGQMTWSEQYDREGVDVFAAQSDIALKVADVLNASVTLDERARVGKPPTSSVAAYELFIRSRNPPGKTAEERFKAAHDLLRQAIGLDPQFAAAYSEIARRSSFEGAYWGDRVALGRGLDAAHKALAIDPQLPDAYHGLAMNLHQLGRLQEALVAHRKAIELNPSFGAGLTDISFSETVAGHYDEALKYAKRAFELAPNGGALYYHGGVALLSLDDDARTERLLMVGAARFPDNLRVQTLLAFLDLRRGRTEAAVARMRAAANQKPDSIEVLLTRAEVLTFAGTADAADVVRSLVARAADGLFHNAPYPVKLAHAYHLQRAGSIAEAAKIMDEMTAANRESLLAGADWPLVFMQNAAIHALRGQRTAALDELDRGYAAGWRDGRTLAIDPLFTAVRSEPRFKQLLSRIEADVAAMRARADYAGLP